MSERNIYIAIMVAAAKGRGLRLSIDDVADLAFDDAIQQFAVNCLDDSDWPDHHNLTGSAIPWEKIDPSRNRAARNLACIAPGTRLLSRCPTCHRSDEEYSAFEGYCSDPWHGDDHLRRSAALLGDK